MPLAQMRIYLGHCSKPQDRELAISSSALPSIAGDPSSQAETTAAVPESTSLVTLERLQQAMAGAASGTQAATPTVGELLHPDILQVAFADEAMSEALPSLASLLPEEDRRNPRYLTDVLRSPALRAQAAALTNALASGGVEDLLASFGLPVGDPAASTAVGAAGLQAFFRALRNIPRTKRSEF